MKVDLQRVRPLAFLQGLIIGLGLIAIAANSASAQGICVADTLSVTAVAGKVVAKFNKGETPLDEAVVILKRGDDSGPVIAKRPIKEDGSFSFNSVKPGKYQLKVTATGLSNFYLDLVVRRPKARKDQKEIIIIIGTDFMKPCSGSHAELRVK